MRVATSQYMNTNYLSTNERKTNFLPLLGHPMFQLNSSNFTLTFLLCFPSKLLMLLLDHCIAWFECPISTFNSPIYRGNLNPKFGLSCPRFKGKTNQRKSFRALYS